MNDQIKSPEVRVVNPDGEQLGILPVAEALEISASLGLDLVEVAPDSTPPVCRIMDYGKFKYLQSKRVQDSHKKKSTIQVKEIKLRPNTEDHDIDYKVKKAKKFLQEGNKTKISMVFKGRELSHIDLGMATMDKVKKMIGDAGSIEKEPKLEGRMMVMIFAPAKGK